MKQLWPEILQRPHIRAVLGDEARPESPHRAWPIPARIDQAVLATGRTLFAGDAAAATDVMTGEGIGQALLTRSEEHTSELQSLMRISYAVFCLKKNKKNIT